MSRVVRRCALLAAVLVSVLGTTACVGLPDSGPVVTVNDEARTPPDVGVERRAQPPQEGDSPQGIVTGFLQAMTAYPVTTNVARLYLASDEQDAWDPSRKVVSYEGRDSAKGADPVRITLQGAHWVDSRGTWRGSLGTGERTLRFPMVRDNGEWRIAAAPDAFIVPDDWFQDHYVSASVYYLDPTAAILVPEPVFVPGDELVTSLVQSLLDGPGPRLEDVSRSFVPTGLTQGLSIPVDEDGVARITLQGDAGRLAPEAAKLMVYQFAWTLRQDPDVTGFQITIGDQPVTLESGGTKFSVALGSEYQPTDVQASPLLFAVRNGRLEAGDSGGTTPVTGSFGTAALGIEQVAISLDASTAAAVAGGRTALQLGPVSAATPPADTVLSGATRLLRPAWDFADRLWVVDRTPQGATVSVIDTRHDLVPVPVTIAGISGEQVKRFIVSRDGTRLVAVVHGPQADELRIARIRYDSTGRVLPPARSRPLPWSSGDIQRIRDIGWRSPTSVAVLHSLTQQVAQVVSVPVDGSVGHEERIAQQDPARALVASPVSDETLYTLTVSGQLLDPTGAEGPATPLPSGVTSVQYVG